MSTHNGVLSAAAAALVLTLGCSAGDLTLPSPGGPAALVVVSGDGQQAEAGALLAEPLAVRLVDGGTRPVSGASVRFRFVGDLPGAKLDPASVLTDADGRAAAIVRLGEATGEQIIVAEVTNTQLSDLRARFSATAVPPDGNNGGKKGGGSRGNGGGHGGGSEDGGD
jgi:hypothetical protein